MKITRRTKQARAGFTLIEMIGVLAVIAILAALLIPKIFEAINNARINNAAIGIQTVKTAAADWYGKSGSFTKDNTVAAAPDLTAEEQNQFDMFLLNRGYLEKPFSLKIGDAPGDAATRVSIVPAEEVADEPDGTNAAYDLSGAGDPLNHAAGSFVVHAIITSVAEQDAKDLNDRIDGIALGADLGAADLVGRVKYGAVEDGLVDVYVYLAHR